MKYLGFLILSLAFALPAYANTAWEAAEVLRNEAGRIERLLYRDATPERRADIADRLARMQAAWQEAAPAFGPDGAAAEAALTAYADSAGRGDAANAARYRQLLWAALIRTARDRALAALAAGDGETAAGWLNIRDYARASGDTAAVLAVQALRAGQLDAQGAHDAVQSELLTVAASELRRALTRASEDAAKGYMTQYAGDLGRIEGLFGYLRDNMAERLDPRISAALTDALTRAATDPAAITELQAGLAGYAPVVLSSDERDRRARLLRRFTALVWIEYKDGVRNGEVSIPMEYNEAQMFRDRAALILGDLLPQIADSADARRLSELMAQIKQRMDARADNVQPLVDEALILIDGLFGTGDDSESGYATAVEMLPDTLDELAMMVSAGDWAEAEMRRLEAYSWFDPDIEQRLVPRAPSMALRLEARFWEGSAERPGLGRLIADQAPKEALDAEIAGIKTDLALARERIEAPLTPAGALLQSAGIIIREGLEAVLILAALLAALRAEGVDPARFRTPIGTGVALALAGSFGLWAATRWLFSLSTLAREALEGWTALVAAVVLIWMILGLSARGGHVAALRRKLAGSVTTTGVALLAFFVVFREGFETVLFYEALLVDAAPVPVLIGLAAGAAVSLICGWLILVSGRKLPLRLMFRFTSILLGILAVMLVGAGIRGLQSAALIGATPVVWFPDRDWLQLWFGLFPVAEPLAAQALTLILLALPLIQRTLTSVSGRALNS